MAARRGRVASIALSAELTAFAHATEEPDRVKQALLNSLPGDSRGELEGWVTTALLKGYYGNPILVFKLRVEEPEKASVVLRWIIENLPPEDVALLNRTLEQRIDGSGHLYIRLDKQQAFLGRIRVYDGDDVIRVKGKLSPRSRSLLEEGDLRLLLEVPEGG